MTRARNSANLASHGNLFVDITNDRTGIGSVVPGQSLHVAGTAGFHGDVTFTGDLYNATWDRSDNSLKFVDNAKIKFGTSGDLEIYHSGSHSFIDDNGTGNLQIRTNGTKVTLQGGTNAMLNAIKDGAVELYHNNAKKFETTAYGTNTTGTAVNDGLVVAGVATVTTMNVTGVLTYEDVTSVDSVGIITARQGVHIDDSITHIGDTNTRIRFPSNDAINLETGGTPRLSIDSSGNVTISGNLTVSGTTTQNNSVSTTEKTITLASGSANNAAVDGAGLVIDAGSDTDKTLKWLDSTDRWTFTGGDVAANAFYGDGSNLTGISGVSIANQSNNRLITATGTTDALNAEGNLTFDGATLTAHMSAATPAVIIGDSNRTGAGQHLAEFRGYWDGNHVARIVYAAGTDTTNKDDGIITVHTTPSGGGITERIRINSSGQVGINTTSGGLVAVAVNSSNTNHLATGFIALNLKNTNTTDNTSVCMDFQNSVGGIVGRFGAQFKDTSDKDTDLYFATRADGGVLSERLRITSDGKVGINDLSPERTLDVGGDILGNAFMLKNNSSPSPSIQAQIYRAANNVLAIATNGANERLRIGSDGRVGINQSSPDAASLHIGNSVSTSGSNVALQVGTISGQNRYLTINHFSSQQNFHSVKMRVNDNALVAMLDLGNPYGSTGHGTQIKFSGYGDNEVAAIQVVNTAQNSSSAVDMAFRTGGTTERFRIHSGGDVSINTVGAKLYTNNSGGNLTIQGGATYPGAAIKFNGGANGGTGHMHFYSGNATSLEQRMMLLSSGRLLIGTSTDASAGATDTGYDSTGDLVLMSRGNNSNALTLVNPDTIAHNAALGTGCAGINFASRNYYTTHGKTGIHYQIIMGKGHTSYMDRGMLKFVPGYNGDTPYDGSGSTSDNSIQFTWYGGIKTRGVNFMVSAVYGLSNASEVQGSGGRAQLQDHNVRYFGPGSSTNNAFGFTDSRKRITFYKKGYVLCDFMQDFIGSTSNGYSYWYVAKNGTNMGNQLIENSEVSNEWSSIQYHHVIPVSENDYLEVYFAGSHWTNLDSSDWSFYRFVWYNDPEHTSGT